MFFSSVVQSCPTLCNPMDCSTTGFPVQHHLTELTQTHVHSVGDTIPPSHPLLSPSPTFDLSQHQMSQFFTSSGHRIGASASVLPMNIYSGLISFKMDWLDLLAVHGTLRESSQTPQFKSINSLALSFLYSPSLTTTHDYWKNHSFDYMDLCLQSDISAF